MGNNNNWQGWVAIVLSGLALFVAMGSWRAGVSQPVMVAAQQAPRVERPAEVQEPFQDERFSHGPNAHFERGFGHGPWADERGFGHGPGRGHGILGLVFGLIFGLGKLIALGLLAWLLFRFFTKRNNPSTTVAPSTAGPTTPAGHDPRVE